MAVRSEELRSDFGGTESVGPCGALKFRAESRQQRDIGDQFPDPLGRRRDVDADGCLANGHDQKDRPDQNIWGSISMRMQVVASSSSETSTSAT